MRIELFMYFCIKNYSGTQGEDLATVALTPGHPTPHPNPHERSKAVGMVFFLLCVA